MPPAPPAPPVPPVPPPPIPPPPVPPPPMLVIDDVVLVVLELDDVLLVVFVPPPEPPVPTFLLQRLSSLTPLSGQHTSELWPRSAPFVHTSPVSQSSLAFSSTQRSPSPWRPHAGTRAKDNTNAASKPKEDGERFTAGYVAERLSVVSVHGRRAVRAADEAHVRHASDGPPSPARLERLCPNGDSLLLGENAATQRASKAAFRWLRARSVHGPSGWAARWRSNATAASSNRPC